MAIGDYLIRRNGSDTDSVPNAGSNLDVTSWSEQVSVLGTDVTYSAGVFTLVTAGVYLVIASERFNTANTTNNERIEVQQELLVGGATSVYARSQGYIRKSSGDQDCVCHGAAILRTTSANETVQVRYYRTDNSTTGTVDRVSGAGGGVQIIRLDESDEFARYRNTGTQSITTTETTLTFDTNDEEDASFSRSGGDITINNTDRYFVCYSVDVSETATTRSSVVSFLTVNGTLKGGMSMSMQRGADGCQDGALSGCAILSLTATDVLRLRADVRSGGTHTGADANLQIWRLPATAETIIVEATGGDMNSSGDFAFDTQLFDDSSVMSYSAGTANINCGGGVFGLAVGSLFADNATGPQRAAPVASFTNSLPSKYAIDDTYHRVSGGVGHGTLNLCAFLPGASGNVAMNIVPEAASGTVTVTFGQFAIIDLTSAYSYSLPPAITDMEDEQFGGAEADVDIDGVNFEAVQGTGTVEMSDTSDFTGTVVTQTVNTWSDTAINIDIVQGAIPDGLVYFRVTNDSGGVSGAYQANLGFLPYDPASVGPPDHFWTFNNTLVDSVGSNNAGQSVVGSPSLVVKQISRSTTHSYRFAATNDRSEVSDSPFTNVTNQHSSRNVGGWVEIDSLQLLPAAIYEEGGGVNNIYFILGFGNILLANAADTSNGWKVQAYSDRPLIPNRPYHILIDMQGSGGNGDIRIWIDGVLQSKRDGTITSAAQSTHSGDWCFGQPDGSLDTGDTDITYLSATTFWLSNWGTWSNTGGGAPLSSADIFTGLFRNGAVEEFAIPGGTESAMQTSIETYDDTTHNDWPLTFAIPDSTDTDFELTLTNQVFPDEVSMHIRYTGAGVLTIRNSGTSNVDPAKCYAPTGTLNVVETANVTIEVRDITDQSNVTGARVLLLADSGGPLPSEESVTIVRSGSTATVTHTAHGFTRSDSRVLVEGSDQGEYNGVKSITIIDANSYSFTVTGTPTTPATGTITATAVLISGETVAGSITAEIDYTADQPVTGRVRRGSSATFYKTGLIAGTIPATGLTNTVFLIRD